MCCRRLAVDRGTFFHLVYRIEQKLGRAFAEVEPYALYPVREYFSDSANREPAGFRKVVPIAPRFRRPLALTA